MKRTAVFVTALLVAALWTLPVQAQMASPWSAELRVGAGIPTQELGGMDLNIGYGSELTVGYQFMPSVGAYVGWTWYHFDVDDSSDQGFSDFGVEDTGYAFGLRFSPPFRTDLAPWIIAGGVLDHVEFEGDDLVATKGSDHTLGWEVGGGVTWRINRTLTLTPGVRYRSFESEFELVGDEHSSNLSYVTAEVGLRARF